MNHSRVSREDFVITMMLVSRVLGPVFRFYGPSLDSILARDVFFDIEPAILMLVVHAESVEASLPIEARIIHDNPVSLQSDPGFGPNSIGFEQMTNTLSRISVVFLHERIISTAGKYDLYLER